MKHLSCIAVLVGLTVLSLLIGLGCHAPKSPPPTVVVPPPVDSSLTQPAAMHHYKHEVRIGGAGPAMLQAIRDEYVLAVARVNDTSKTGTPFGDTQVTTPVMDVAVKVVAQPGQTTHAKVGVDDSLRQEKLTAQPTPTGFGQQARARLMSYLVEARHFTVVERENINDIVREIQFGQSKWTAKGDQALPAGELESVKYIVAGNLESNPQALVTREVTADNWADSPSFPEDQSNQKAYIFRLRMYSARTGIVAAVGIGYGDTPDEAMKTAVNALAAEAVRQYKVAHP
ncbi:MAG: hypothetical protein HQ546_04975 [Planctomycetes bacterium]|nr:hypothetical protein [Planctomycetota bacterium]